MSAWITDRLPTREDGDYEGLVWWQRTCGTIVRINYSLICSGEPWQPITYPEPYQKPKVWVVNASGVFKNGRRLGVYDITEREWDTIEDALNKLEEGV